MFPEDTFNLDPIRGEREERPPPTTPGKRAAVRKPTPPQRMRQKSA